MNVLYTSPHLVSSDVSCTDEHITDFTVAMPTTSSNPQAPARQCIDEELLRMVSTTPLHPMKSVECGERRRTLCVTACADSPGMGSPLTGRTSVPGFNASNSTRAGAGGILRTGVSARSQPRNSARGSARGASLTPGMNGSFSRSGGLKGLGVAGGGAALGPSCSSVPAAVTSHHILEGSQRATVLGYEDGTVRLIHCVHQENRDDGLPRPVSAPVADVGSDVREWTLADLIADAPDCVPPMVALSLRGTELSVARLEPLTAAASSPDGLSGKRRSPSTVLPAVHAANDGAGASAAASALANAWSPVMAVHAVPCDAVVPQILTNTTQGSATVGSAVMGGTSSVCAADGAILAVAYQDCVVIMMEPFAAPPAPQLSATQRRRAMLQMVRVVVSASTLRHALIEALGGPACAAKQNTSPFADGTTAAPFAGQSQSAASPQSHQGAGGAQVPHNSPEGPLAIVGVRLSPCGHYLAVHLASPLLCVLVFELPPLYNVVQMPTDGLESHLTSSDANRARQGVAHIVRPPLRLIAGCRYETDVRAPTSAATQEGAAGTGHTATAVPAASTRASPPLSTAAAAAPVYADSFFLSSATAGCSETGLDDDTGAAPASSTVLMVAWVNSSAFARLTLQSAASGMTTSAQLQRVLHNAVDASRWRAPFDDTDALGGGGVSARPPSSSSRGRVSSARRDRGRQSTSSGGGQSATRRPGSSGKRRSVSSPHAKSHTGGERGGGGGRRRLSSLRGGASTNEADWLQGGTDTTASSCVFARAQLCRAAHRIQRACAVSGDPRLALLGLEGGTVQLMDAHSTSRALVSLVPPSRLPLTAAEACRDRANVANTRADPCLRSATSTMHLTQGGSAQALDANQSLRSEMNSCVREGAAPPIIMSLMTAAARQTPCLATAAADSVGAGFVTKPFPAHTAITCLQAFADETAALCVVGATTTTTAPSTTTRLSSGASPSTSSTNSGAGVARRQSRMTHTVAKASSEEFYSPTQTTCMREEDEAGRAHFDEAAAQPLTLHGAAVIHFAPHQFSTPSERSYLTHLPGPATAVLPLLPLPAVLVRVAAPDSASDPGSPMENSIASAGGWRQGDAGLVGGLAHVSSGVHSPSCGSPLRALQSTASTAMTVWWDTAHRELLGTVPSLHVRAASPSSSLLESLHGLASGGSAENTATDLVSSSMPSRGGRLCSTTSRRQASRAQKRAEAEMGAPSSVPLVPCRLSLSPTCGWYPSRVASGCALGADAALCEGPALLWLEEAVEEEELSRTRNGASSGGGGGGPPHHAPSSRSMTRASSVVVTRPVCWPVQALLQLAYPRLAAQLPDLPLSIAARVLRCVPPSQRHCATAYRHLSLEADDTQAITTTTRLGTHACGHECGPSTTFPSTTALSASNRLLTSSRPQSQTGPAAHSPGPRRLGSPRQTPGRPQSGSSVGSRAARRPASGLHTPGATLPMTGRINNTATAVALPTLFYTTTMMSAKDGARAGRPTTSSALTTTTTFAAAPASRATPGRAAAVPNAQRPYCGCTSQFPQAWLAALGDTASNRQAQLEAIVGQLHLSKA